MHAFIITALATMLVGPPQDTLRTPETVTRRGPVVLESLSAVQLDITELESLGTQQYGVRMHARGNTGGAPEYQSMITLSTSVMGGRVVLEDQWIVMGRTYAYNAWCRLDGLLSMESIDMTVQRGDDVTNARLVIRDGKGRLETEDREIDMDYPPGTVSQAALFRIVPLLPRTPGRAYTFPGYTEAIELRARHPEDDGLFRILCRGIEAITIDGRKNVQCTRYTIEVDRTFDFFVDESGALRRIVADNGETIMVRLPDPAHAGADGVH